MMIEFTSALMLYIWGNTSPKPPGCCFRHSFHSILLRSIALQSVSNSFSGLGVNLKQDQALNHWHDLITVREAWKTTNPDEEEFNQWKFYLQRLIKLANLRRQRQFRQL